MGLIFWVDENKFVADLVGKVFRKKGLEFYHLESVEEFSFRVMDLKPEMIVIDGETLERKRDLFKDQFAKNPSLENYSYVLKGETDFSDFPRLLGKLPLPLDPFQVPDLLRSMK